ncbi:MAG TPA: hypothetical protein VL294_11510 [Pseudolysinimonas sp.]|jgi:hypothetical protein|nr:hypothetical protein [Pseudolysinimonas sp.]
MERIPHHHPEQQPANGLITERLLAELPPAREAAGLITMALSDQTRDDYFNALSRSRDIEPATARAIAYNLMAHAPIDATTEALERYFATGIGSRDQLLAEYLPLYENPEMPAEGRLLLDALGTHLFRREHPTAATVGTPGYALDGGLFYTDDGEGERVAVAFQLPMGLPADDAERVAHYLERPVRRYGDAFRAFLRLPGVDATSLGLVTYYLGVHALEGEAETLLAQADQGERDPERRGPVPAWEAVEIGGRLHVFTR